MNRTPSSVFSTVSIVSICRSQLGRFLHFLIALGSRSSTIGLFLFEDDAGEGDAFRLTPLLFLPLFLDLVSSSSSSASSSPLPDLAFCRSLPRFFCSLKQFWCRFHGRSCWATSGGLCPDVGLASSLFTLLSLTQPVLSDELLCTYRNVHENGIYGSKTLLTCHFVHQPSYSRRLYNLLT